MKQAALIFYGITTVLIGLILVFQDSFLLAYLEVFYVLFIFAESYYVLQNYDFDHGIPFYATFIKLANTLTVLISPLAAFIIHIIIHIYIYSHIRGLDKRHKRLKYDYTVNNVVPGPFLLKLFASFLSPILFVPITILGSLRIRQKLILVKRTDLLKYFILGDIAVLIILLTRLHVVAFLVYMIMLIIFEFIPVENKIVD